MSNLKEALSSVVVLGLTLIRRGLRVMYVC